MTDRLQQKAREIVVEGSNGACIDDPSSPTSAYYRQYAMAFRGLTAGIAMAAEREIIAKALHESGQCHYDRGTWEQLKASGKECTCSETADIVARALAKGETQHG